MRKVYVYYINKQQEDIGKAISADLKQAQSWLKNVHFFNFEKRSVSYLERGQELLGRESLSLILTLYLLKVYLNTIT